MANWQCADEQTQLLQQSVARGDLHQAQRHLYVRLHLLQRLHAAYQRVNRLSMRGPSLSIGVMTVCVLQKVVGKLAVSEQLTYSTYGGRQR